MLQKRLPTGKPSLTLTYTDETLYTASFTANSGAITPTVTIYSDAERETPVSNGTLTDKNTYYYRAVLAGYDNYEGSFTVDGANPSVSYTMTAKTRYTFTVNAVDAGSNILETIYIDEDSYEGKTHTIVYPKYLTGTGNIVTYSKDNDTYGESKTAQGKNETFDVRYTAYDGIAYFVEVEDVVSATAYGSWNCSNGRAVRGFTAAKSIFTVPAEGNYDITYAACNNNVSYDLAVTLSKNDTEIATKSDLKSVSINFIKSTGIVTNNNVSLAKDDVLKLTPSSTNGIIDYMLIRNTPVSYTVKYMCGSAEIKDADASRNASWGTNVTLTDDDKADIEIDGRIYRYSSDDASSQTIASDGSTVITVNFEFVGNVSTVTYSLNVGAGSQTTITSENSSTNSDLNTIVGVTNNTSEEYGSGGGKDNLTVKIPTQASYDESKYMSVGFTVADGHKFTPTSVVVKAQPVSTNKTVKLVLTDGVNSIEKVEENLAQGSITTVTATNDEATSFTGNVTLKIYCYGATDTYRLGSPITVEGLIDHNDEIKNAIADCKIYETSSSFATAIDAESFSTVAEVYAYHSAWQVAQAMESGSTDYSKAIMNRTFELHNANGWTIFGDPATGGADSDNNGIVEYGEGWSQYYTGWNGRNVSQSIATLPAGTYRLTAKVYSWDDGAPVRLFANGKLADAEDGADHDPVLDFTVTGSEPSIKIGIGGTGHENNTDNTWGNWGYRVKNFTLTKTGETVTIGASGFATFSSPYALNFDESDVTPYCASAASGGIVTMTKLTGDIAANTGLFLKGDNGADTYSIPVAATAGSAPATNYLKPTTGSNIYDGEKCQYVYAYQNSTYGFFKVASSGLAPAKGKAYLETAASAAGARMTITFDDEVTGIENLTPALSEGKGAFYDLQGRRVAQPTKGLYIVNGRKVVVK